MQKKLKKGGKGAKKGGKKSDDKEGSSAITKPSTKKRKAPATSSIAAPKRRKQPTRKRKSPTPNLVRNEEPRVHNDGEIMNLEVTQTINEFVLSPPPSPKTTTTLITIAPCLPPVSSSQQTSIPLSTPIFTESTPPPTTSATPAISVNTSDFGARVLGFTTTYVSPPISLFRTDEPDMIYGDGDHDKFQSSISSQLSKIHDDLAMERKIMDALTVKVEKAKTLSLKLEQSEKQVQDLLSEKEVMKSCIYDVTALLSDLIEARDLMILLNKLFSDDPIIDNEEEEELDEAELKRRKDHEAEMDEHQCIIREVEAKEKAEKEAQVTLESKKLVFPTWTLKHLQYEVVDMPREYCLEPVVSFELQNIWTHSLIYQ
ncbi:unnamed protein product [Lactuca saligna]|uniref:Uncharacterized protein n=1 Tax=Lactuca saligna TaxID=75948 RepID=A0AA35ZKG9_LACSI|nr:unnamed protein product [Lactuca saligna]